MTTIKQKRGVRKNGRNSQQPQQPNLIELSAAFSEVGTSGLDYSSGVLNEAYLSELTWPSVSEKYEKLYRSDPEVAVARTVLDAFSSKLEIGFIVPERDSDKKPSGDDRKATDFGNQVLEEIQGGVGQWFSSAMSRAILMGWCWHEIVWGLRNPNWTPPDRSDDWQSRYDDNLVGVDLPPRQILVAPEYTSVTVPEGDEVSIDLTVANQGKQDEFIDLSLTQVPKGWKARIKTYSFDDSGVFVPSDKANSLTLKAEAEEGTGPGKYVFGIKGQTQDGKLVSTSHVTVMVREKDKEKKKEPVAR